MMFRFGGRGLIKMLCANSFVRARVLRTVLSASIEQNLIQLKGIPAQRAVLVTVMLAHRVTSRFSSRYR